MLGCCTAQRAVQWSLLTNTQFLLPLSRFLLSNALPNSKPNCSNAVAVKFAYLDFAQMSLCISLWHSPHSNDLKAAATNYSFTAARPSPKSCWLKSAMALLHHAPPSLLDLMLPLLLHCRFIPPRLLLQTVQQLLLNHPNSHLQSAWHMPAPPPSPPLTKSACCLSDAAVG